MQHLLCWKTNLSAESLRSRERDSTQATGPKQKRSGNATVYKSYRIS